VMVKSNFFMGFSPCKEHSLIMVLYKVVVARYLALRHFVRFATKGGMEEFGNRIDNS